MPETRPADAPDLSPGYPSRGSRIGPAWADVWEELGDGRWHERDRLAAAAAARHELRPWTVARLIDSAAGIRASLLWRRSVDGRMTVIRRDLSDTRPPWPKKDRP